MKLKAFWHWLTTSRYTRELERQRDALQTRVDRLERDNLMLMRQLYPRLGLQPDEPTPTPVISPVPGERKPRMR